MDIIALSNLFAGFLAGISPQTINKEAEDRS
jgi:hypothetical protein